MQEIDQRPAKKRRFFVEESDPDNLKRLPKDSIEPSTLKAEPLPPQENRDNTADINGQQASSATISVEDGIEAFSNEMFRFVVEQDMSDAEIEKWRSLSGNNLQIGS